MKILLGFLASAVSLYAQHGVSTRSSTFDPATSPRGPLNPGLLKAPDRRSRFTAAEEAQHRAFVPTAGPTGIPQIEARYGRRAPGDLQNQLQNAPSVSTQGLIQDL